MNEYIAFVEYELAACPRPGWIAESVTLPTVGGCSCCGCAPCHWDGK